MANKIKQELIKKQVESIKPEQANWLDYENALFEAQMGKAKELADTGSLLNKVSGKPAVAFYNKDGGYVVVDEATKEVIQIGSVKSKNWIPDSSIIDPYIP